MSWVELQDFLTDGCTVRCEGEEVKGDAKVLA